MTPLQDNLLVYMQAHRLEKASRSRKVAIHIVTDSSVRQAVMSCSCRILFTTIKISQHH